MIRGTIQVEADDEIHGQFAARNMNMSCGLQVFLHNKNKGKKAKVLPLKNIP